MEIVPKYKHGEIIHNMVSPRIITEKLFEFYQPKNVVDFGCGVGNFLMAFKEKGVEEVLGLDGVWANMELLKKYIDSSDFREVDLEEKICLDKKYDLAISLEVAEHLSEKKSAVFVDSLVNASDVILFSAAIPFQGGQNHVNEQWINFWQRKFSNHDYIFCDLFRRDLWDNEKVEWWYKQNMFLVVSKSHSLYQKIITEQIVKVQNIIHPDNYLSKIDEYSHFRSGKSKPKKYLKLFVKSILYKYNILKK